MEESSATAADKTRFKQGAGVLRELTSLLGILLDPPTKAAASDDGTLAKVMELMIALRQEARQRKDFALSDRIRDGLAAIGVTLQDGREGTRWKVEST